MKNGVIDTSKLYDNNYYWIEFRNTLKNRWIISEYYKGEFFIVGNSRKVAEYLINDIDYKPISR